MEELINKIYNLPSIAHYAIASICLLIIVNYCTRNQSLIEKESKFFGELIGWASVITTISWLVLGIRILGIDKFFGFSLPNYSILKHASIVLLGCFVELTLEELFKLIYGKKRKFKFITCPECNGAGYISCEAYIHTDTDYPHSDIDHNRGCKKCGGGGRSPQNPYPGYNDKPLTRGTGKIIVPNK